MNLSKHLVALFLIAIVILGIPLGVEGCYRAASVRHIEANSPPAVVNWTNEIALPDDILFVRHQSWERDALIFLVSLDSGGKVATLRPISGFSLYLHSLEQQIGKFSFSRTLYGKTFVLRIPDPLQKFIVDVKLYHTGVCTSTADLRLLYQLGAMLWRDKDNGAASHCYKYILDRNPSSVAARYGIADICLSSKDPCADWYLQGLVASNPEFIEARKLLVQRYQFNSDEAEEKARASRMWMKSLNWTFLLPNVPGFLSFKQYGWIV